ncbi:hypothetical protein Pmani_033156 [Petrolisthes manimaculis]|uniref:Uncharacterized protein n=1 Tax=Petrolisthes manimaculis TaxID=1843537 RepID=A0AAE1NR20_9EUCA|nr:hypothetical protein Pmani_033156 [Petrolisthes manimaculis]
MTRNRRRYCERPIWTELYQHSNSGFHGHLSDLDRYPARPAEFYGTIMCGAERSTATVAVMVKSVKMMRHSRSTTIAANFQSFLTCTGDRVSAWGLYKLW